MKHLFNTALVAILSAAPSAGVLAGGEAARHLIYVHGAIIQSEQLRRPQHPRFGFYELDQILDAFRSRGFVASGEVRPKDASMDQSANVLVEQVRELLRSGVPPDHVTVVGASMGGGIALLAQSRLQEDRVRFGVLGVCVSDRIQKLLESGERAPRGHVLSFREESDELTTPCASFKSESGLDVREVVLHTGLAHGFLYRPLPEWVGPMAEFAKGAR